MTHTHLGHHAVPLPALLVACDCSNLPFVARHPSTMSERRFTRSAARAVEEQTITVKREQQSAARQAQQRAARQTSDVVSTFIHIDVDEESAEQPSTAAAAAQQDATLMAALSSGVAALAAHDDLPALEEHDEQIRSAIEAAGQLQAQLRQTAASLALSLPLLEMPPLQAVTSRPPQPPPRPTDNSVKREESWEEERKELSTQTVSVKAEVKAKVEKREKEEKYEVDALSGMVVEEEESKEADSDDEPIAVRLSRRPRRGPPAVVGRVQRARRDRRAVPDEESSSSDSDSDFEEEDSGDEGAGGGDDSDDEGDEDEEDDGDELDGDEDDVISRGGLDPLSTNDDPSMPLPPDETDLLLSSTSPATFIAPFLNFTPSSVPPLTDRYCLTLALSSRSRCRRCRENIIAGYPRIGQQARLCSHLITRWYHPSCWTLTAIDGGRQRVGGRLGALITEEEKERVGQLEGRLERLDEYEALLGRLNDKERASWKKSLDALEKRKKNIEEWRESGGVRRQRKKKRKTKTKQRTKKAGKAGKGKKRTAETDSGDEEWEQPEERKEEVEPTRVKRERAVKSEAGVKREGGVKREPQVKKEKQAMVKVEGRVKRERGEDDEKQVDEDEENEAPKKRNKRRVKKE